MATTNDETTTEMRQLAIRLPAELVSRIEAHAARLRAELPGLTITRTDAVRLLIADAVGYAEKQAATSSAPTK